MKMIKSFVSALFFGAMLVGCAVNPQHVSTAPDLEICQSYGVYSRGAWSSHAESYKQEIERRKLLSQDDWDTVAQRKIKRGMSQCAMYASWGRPDRENRSVGSWGTHIQHIFNSGYTYIKPTYVYTENGKVTSWQD